MINSKVEYFFYSGNAVGGETDYISRTLLCQIHPTPSNQIFLAALASLVATQPLKQKLM